MRSDMYFYESYFALWISVHLLGLISAWMVRMHAGQRLEGVAMLVFLASLPLLALATAFGQHYCLALWPLSACTLAVMIVTATLDVGSSKSAILSGE